MNDKQLFIKGNIDILRKELLFQYQVYLKDTDNKELALAISVNEIAIYKLLEKLNIE